MRFALHSAKLNGKNRFEFYDEKEYADEETKEKEYEMEWNDKN